MCLDGRNRCRYCGAWCQASCPGQLEAQRLRDAEIRRLSLSLHTDAGTLHWRQERLLDRIEDGSI